MKLYLLRHFSYDETDIDRSYYEGFVIRAKDERTARKLVQEHSQEDEEDREHSWIDPSITYCIEITIEGKESIIIADYGSE